MKSDKLNENPSRWEDFDFIDFLLIFNGDYVGPFYCWYKQKAYTCQVMSSLSNGEAESVDLKFWIKLLEFKSYFWKSSNPTFPTYLDKKIHVTNITSPYLFFSLGNSRKCVVALWTLGYSFKSIFLNYYYWKHPEPDLIVQLLSLFHRWLIIAVSNFESVFCFLTLTFWQSELISRLSFFTIHQTNCKLSFRLFSFLLPVKS